jgi:prepilin-type N-terminal cleavage/methylation domain-containing protein
MNKSSGFTLLEILIVIIIVGVLASVASAQYFRHVKRAQAVEALNTLGLIKRGVQACTMQFAGNPLACAPSTVATFDNIGMTDPSSTVNPLSQFNYTIFCGGIPTSFNCGFVATDKDDGANSVTLSWTNNSTTRSGTGAFAGVQ